MSNPAVCNKTFKLNNGESIHAVGLGTWQGRIGSDDENATEKSIIHALHSGYRLLDTAMFYGVEHIVGRAVRNSGIPRSEITVITKFWGEWHHDPAAALEISLRNLSIDYVDILLMHWPWATTPSPECKPLRKHEIPSFVETWKMMEELVGPRCKSIGVSNFSQKTLDELLDSAKIVPVVNQVELHAFNPNHDLVPYCQTKGIHVISWSTMGGGRNDSKDEILTHDLFTGIAEKHQCSAGVVSLSWAVQRGITVIPKSSSNSRISENIRLVTLDDEDMEKVNNAYRTIKRHRIADGIRILWMEIDGVNTLQGWTPADFGWEDEDRNWLT